MPAIIHQNQVIGQATNAEALVKDTVGWTGKNKAIPQEGYALDGDESTGYRITQSGTNSLCYIAKVENDESYIVSKAAGNRFRIVGFQNYPSVSTKEATAKNIYVGTGATETYTFSNTGNWAYIVFMVNYDNTFDYSTAHGMIRRANITDPTYEPYHESVEEEIEQIYADNGVLGAKNLLQNMATTQTLTGITFTVNADGSVTVNGTASANTSYILRTKTPLVAGKSYIMSRGEVGDNDFQMVATAWNSGSYVKNIIEVGAGGYTEKSFVADYNGYNDIQISIFVRSGKTISNAKVYPMIRLAFDPDDTYQPYAMTNRELTEKVGVWTTPVSCLVGDTTCTIASSAIHTTSTIKAYSETSSGAPVGYEKIVVTEGQAVITFASALTEAANIKLNVLNV